jgi:DNA-binding NarL/FixJ family response regulator
MQRENALVRARNGTQAASVIAFHKLMFRRNRHEYRCTPESRHKFVKCAKSCATCQQRKWKKVAAIDANGGEKSRSLPERIRVIIAAENRLLREALTRMLGRNSRIEVRNLEWSAGNELKIPSEEEAGILLVSSQGSLSDDLDRIQKARKAAPAVRILVLGNGGDEKEFLQCVRAGVSGYLPQDASGEEVIKAVEAVAAGESFCRGRHCGVLFRYFERDSAGLPSAAVRQKLRLTRREQQLIPLLAHGLANKGIAKHFSLSEQAIKNHVHRMKNKIGAGDRLDIVQLYRVQGFLV